MYMCVTASCSN